jgi:hypothetical protein
MNLEQLDNPAFLLILVPAITIGLNELLKKVGMNDKWCPIVNLLVGGWLAFLLLFEIGFNITHSIIVGLMIGLSAGGFFDLVKYSIFKKE